MPDMYSGQVVAADGERDGQEAFNNRTNATHISHEQVVGCEKRTTSKLEKGDGKEEKEKSGDETKKAADNLSMKKRQAGERVRNKESANEELRGMTSPRGSESSSKNEVQLSDSVCGSIGQTSQTNLEALINLRTSSFPSQKDHENSRDALNTYLRESIRGMGIDHDGQFLPAVPDSASTMAANEIPALHGWKEEKEEAHSNTDHDKATSCRQDKKHEAQTLKSKAKFKSKYAPTGSIPEARKPAFRSSGSTRPGPNGGCSKEATSAATTKTTAYHAHIKADKQREEWIESRTIVTDKDDGESKERTRGERTVTVLSIDAGAGQQVHHNLTLPAVLEVPPEVKRSRSTSFMRSCDERLTCKALLVTQVEMLTKAIGHMIREIGGHFAHYTWEPRLYHTWLELKHHFNVMKTTYAVLNHSVRLSTASLTERMEKHRVIVEFARLLRPSLLRLAKEFRRNLMANAKLHQGTDHTDSKFAATRLKLAFRSLMEKYYHGRARLLYQDRNLRINMKVTQDLLMLNVLMYSIRNLVKAAISVPADIAEDLQEVGEELQDTDKKADGAPAKDPQSRQSQFRTTKTRCEHSFRRCYSMLPSLGCKPDWSTDNVKNAIKIAVAMLLTSLLVLIPDFEGSFDNAFWGPLTIAFVMGRSTGSSVKQSILRLQGTVSGAIFGYTLLRLTDSNKAAVLFALPALVFFASLAKPSSEYGYAGVVTAFTSGIIVLGFASSPLSISEYALARIELTAIGIVVWFAVVVFLFPFDPRAKLQQEMLSSLRTMATWVRTLADATDDHLDTSGCRELFKKVDRSVGAQRELLSEAKSAPAVVSNPFPANATERLLLIMVRIKRTLDALSRVAAEWKENNFFVKETKHRFLEVHELCASVLAHFSTSEIHPLSEGLKYQLQRSLEKLLDNFSDVVRTVLKSTSSKMADTTSNIRDNYGDVAGTKERDSKRGKDSKPAAAHSYGLKPSDWNTSNRRAGGTEQQDGALPDGKIPFFFWLDDFQLEALSNAR